MVSVLAWILLSVFIVSVISLIGVITLVFNPKLMKKSLTLMVSFAAGAMLATAFLDLIPAALEKTTNNVFLLVLVGIVIFLFTETFLYWYHCHNDHCEAHTHHQKKHKPQPFTYLNLAGDAMHNFLDGVIIAGAFLASIPLGIITSLAVIFHEIPQEIGDFSILVYGGFNRFQALWYNFLTALTAVLGAVIAYFFASTIAGLSGWLIPIAAGGFIYIAGVDLLPELHKQKDLRKASLQLVFFVLGIAIIWAISNYLHV